MYFHTTVFKRHFGALLGGVFNEHTTFPSIQDREQIHHYKDYLN